MTTEVKNLTPVTLELVGKCRAVFDSLSSSWDVKIALNRLLGAKFASCTGQACIAIDYILVEKKFLSRLVELLKEPILNVFGKNPKQSGTVVRIVNRSHFSRLRNLLDGPMVKESIVHGGKMDEDKLFIEPTLLVDSPLEAGIMTEQIFGP